MQFKTKAPTKIAPEKKILVNKEDMVDEQNSSKLKMLYYKYTCDKCLFHYDLYPLQMTIAVNR
jgi:hypothetical protein